LWQVLASKKFQKQLEKLDSQISKQILEDMECLKEAPMQSEVSEDPRARKLGIRYIRVAQVWRLFFRMRSKQVLVEFVAHRETGHEEIARYLRAINL
jgi:mRNA-degrading endonuclease RelE of RelBE toxin-antitoxin system